MSHSGQGRTSRAEIAISALPPKADIRPRDQDVCFGPLAEIISRKLPSTRGILACSKQSLCCPRSYLSPARIAMDEHQGHRAFGQQHDLSGTVASGDNPRDGQFVREPSFHSRLVFARNCAGGVAAQVGKLNDCACESPSGIFRFRSPIAELSEITINQFIMTCCGSKVVSGHVPCEFRVNKAKLTRHAKTTAALFPLSY